jgi:hypothetical protein
VSSLSSDVVVPGYFERWILNNVMYCSYRHGLYIMTLV